jgi:hypothetical protein
MRTDPPLITTVIPTYRRPLLLRRAIRSVLSQTYPRAQAWVFDNASGDETAAVVAELARNDPRVKYYCHPENVGMAANFIYGMKQVDTPYFSILSDDDYLLPNFYSTVMPGFEAHPDAMFSGGSVILLTESGQITHVPMDLWQRDGYFPAPEGLLEWTIEKHPYITGLLFRTEVIERVGLFDPEVFHGDYEYEWRIVPRFSYVVSREPCVVITMHEQQATRVTTANEWLLTYRTIRERVGQVALTPEMHARANALLEESFRRSLIVMGLTALRDGNFVSAHAIADTITEHFHARRQARMLHGLTTACQYIPSLHAGLNAVYRLLLRARNRRTRTMQARIMEATKAYRTIGAGTQTRHE